MKQPLVLCILDGCGLKEEVYGNAFKNAKKETYDFLWKHYPHTTLEASGNFVGLPKGQMGNSEVGHMNIGAGKIVYQPQEIINASIETKEIFKNEQILQVINHTKENKSKLHIMGLLSDGGVHSRIEHLFALIDMCVKENVKEIYFHLFTDGRDTSINSAPKFLKDLQEKMKRIPNGVISTISGRYYAMDRDNNYDRVKQAYDVICKSKGNHCQNIEELLEESYQNGITDEFIKPTIINEGKIEDNDGIIVFNYRPDRLREICTAITNPEQSPLDTVIFNNIKFVSMMPISKTVKGLHAFNYESIENTFGQYIDNLGLKQLRIAETEKYAHVTYFFDGGKEIALKNARRILINSHKVKTYDLDPCMSAKEITDSLLNELEKNDLDIIILNFANGDMVGHTGNYEKAVEAVEHLDICLNRIYESVKKKNGILIVTADHGNCETMLNQDGSINTAHTTNKVPFLITKENLKLKESGKLADIAPTILDLLNIDIPKEFTGESLLK